jgi:hypothetical protein
MEMTMAECLLMELELIRVLLHADRPDDQTLKTMTWCLDRLPGLYGEFVLTYEKRYGDEIRRLVHGVLANVSQAALAQTILDHLLAMHERLGIPDLNLSPRKRKAA